jgi:hypothetical protein
MARVIGTVLLVSLLFLRAIAAVDVVASADPTGDHRVPQTETSDGSSLVVADPSITVRHPIHVDSWSRTLVDESVAVHFALASPDCSGADADVEETTESVTVSLSAGTRPQAVGRMCTMIVVNATLDVPLKAPLGDRVVLSAT